MAEDKDDKEIRATSRKRDRSKRDGNLPRSREFANLSGFLVALVFLTFFSGAGVTALGDMVANHLKAVGSISVNHSTVQTIMGEMVLGSLLVLAPFFIVLFLAGLFFSIAFQGGYVYTLKPFGFKLNKFNPIKGIKKIFFSKQSLANIVRSMLLVMMIIAIAWQSLEEFYPKLFGLQMIPLESALKMIFDFIFYCLYKLALLFIIVAIAELAWTKYSYEENLKMTRKEYQDDLKESEGDPKIKRRIRTVQMQMHRRRMMAEVPRADVVVTNPTHIAVALRYDVEKAVAPEVVAMGQGYIADKIRSIAKENDVPIVENPPLAQTLFRSCEIGEIVPPDLYKAVAEILAYVYKLKGKIPA